MKIKTLTSFFFTICEEKTNVFELIKTDGTNEI